MKREGGLFERIAERENMVRAYLRARRGHLDAPAVVRFGAHLDAELATLRAGILAGDVEVGRYERFESELSASLQSA